MVSTASAQDPAPEAAPAESGEQLLVPIEDVPPPPPAAQPVQPMQPVQVQPAPPPAYQPVVQPVAQPMAAPVVEPDPPVSAAVRVVLEASVAAAISAGVIGIAWWWDENNCSGVDDTCGPQTWALGGTFTFVGINLAVIGLGRGLGGRGRWWTPLVGTAAGMGAWFLLTGALALSDIDGDTFVNTIAVTGPVLGIGVAVLAFELSHMRQSARYGYAEADDAEPTGPTIVPTFALVPEGAVFGAAGAF